MPSAETQPLFDLARELAVGFYLGYAELAREDGKAVRYNTSILVNRQCKIIGKYRKVHLPGHAEHEPWRRFQHLEKRYFTPVHNAPAPAHDDLSLFQNQLSMQAGAYQNGTWVVGVAKAGLEEGVDSIGGSCIVAPSGEVVARCISKGDEVAIARCDLDFCAIYKRTTFNFDLHRRPEAYGLIVARKGETLATDGTPWALPERPCV